MIDIGKKKITKRVAVAEGKIYLPEEVVRRIRENKIEKGDVFKSAEISALFSIKNTPHVIPHCHPVSITKGEISFSSGKDFVKVVSKVEGYDRTGFEMEALTSVSVALLTIYDMCKKYTSDIKISEIKLLKKKGGKSNWKNEG